MATLVEFLVKLNDMVSSPLQKISQSGLSSFNKLESGVSKFQNKFNTLGMNISQIDAKLNNLRKTRKISFDSSQISRINKEIDTLQAKKNRLEGGGSGGGSGGGLGGMFRTGLAIAGVSSLAYLGKDIMQAGLGRQMDLTSLQTLVGKQQGLMLNNQLLDFAKRSIYGNEVFNEGKLMAGSGVKAGNIMPVINMIGDIALGDKERMKSLALAFSEANTRGSLTGVNERMFLQGGLFNPIEQLHLMTKRSLPDLKKDMEKGKISIDMLVQAMEYATGPLGRWHDAMANLQHTPAGEWVAFTGTLRTLAGTIGMQLLPALGKAAELLTALINNKFALYEIAIAIGAMSTAWLVYTGVTKAAAIWTFVLEAFASPEAAIVGIGFVSAALGGLILNHIKLGDTAPPVINGLIKNNNDYGNSAINAADNVTSSANKIIEANGRIAKSANDSQKSLFNSLGKLEDQMVNKKRLEDLAYGKEMSFFKKHGSISDKEIIKIKTQVGLYSADKSLSAFDGKYHPNGKATGGTLGGSTTGSITGGGVRNITINVAKFQDKTEIHTVGLKEGIQEVEEIMRDMFLRITNSAATAMN